jgi:hypothetical protein
LKKASTPRTPIDLVGIIIHQKRTVNPLVMEQQPGVFGISLDIFILPAVAGVMIALTPEP